MELNSAISSGWCWWCEISHSRLCSSIRSVLGEWLISCKVLLRIFHQHLPAAWENLLDVARNEILLQKKTPEHPWMSNSYFCACQPCCGFAQWKKKQWRTNGFHISSMSLSSSVWEDIFQSESVFCGETLILRLILFWASLILEFVSCESRRAWKQDEVWGIIFLSEPYLQGSLWWICIIK